MDTKVTVELTYPQDQLLCTFSTQHNPQTVLFSVEMLGKWDTCFEIDASIYATITITTDQPMPDPERS